MSFSPSVEEQQLLEDTLRLEQAPLPPRERLTEGFFVVAFAVAVAGVWLADPPGSVALAPAAVCLLVLVLATRVRFGTPLGFTVATQLAFVPLLFAMPVAVAPLAVALALALARVPDVLRGRIRPGRLLLAVGNSWFSVGPAAVFGIAGVAPRNAGAALLMAALAAQLAVDFGISSLRFWLDRSANLVAQLRESWIYTIDAALSVIGLVIAEDIHSHPLAALAPVPMLAVLAIFAHERHHRIEYLLELNNAYRGTALVLGDVIEADDGYTGEHSRSVVELALALADQLHLNARRRRNLEVAALLHDIGKIVIPKEIINKPGRLDPSEWMIMQTHTLEGQKMLDRVGGFMREVGLIVRSHHERWDGRGYPDGLGGEGISLEARIIACCDSWNAMRTDRPYRRALSQQVALAELLANSGHQFDPTIVAAFVGIVEPAGASPNATDSDAFATSTTATSRYLPTPDSQRAAGSKLSPT